MTSDRSQQRPEAELRVAFRRHLPPRLYTLKLRLQAQCQGGWDCNVLHQVADELVQLADACDRFGMLDAGTHVRALHATLAAASEGSRLPNADESRKIELQLGALQPFTRPPVHDNETVEAADAAFSGFEVPPAGYWRRVLAGSEATADNAALDLPAAADLPSALESPAHADRRTHPAVAEPAMAIALATGTDAPYRVLIVEDDAAQAMFAKAILQRAGVETQIVGEARPVLDTLKSFNPDLLLLDLNLPDCDGFTLARLVREHQRYAGIPIVFLSGDHDEDRQFEALDAGADDFLVKPIRPTHLVTAVTSRIQRARAAASRDARRPGVSGASVIGHDALLDRITKHLGLGGSEAAPGGLLRVDIHDQEHLAAAQSAGTLEALLEGVGGFVAARAPVDTTLARIRDGGFLLFGPNHREADLASLAADLASAAAGERFGSGAVALRLDCAVYAFEADDRAVEDVLARLQRARDAARAGRAGIAVYSQLDPDPLALPARIASALAGESFTLAFQPLLATHGTAAPHFQALLRLRDSEREFTAAELLPHARRSGALDAIDVWIVQRCVAELRTHARAGEAVRLIASQSLASWLDPARQDALLAQLDGHGDGLVLEFRCEEVRDDLRLLQERANALRGAGVRLALAGVTGAIIDAGWIVQLALDYVKLQPGLSDAEVARVVAAAHAHRARVIGARVETSFAAAALRDAGVDFLQGLWLHAPEPTLAAARAAAAG